MEVEGTGRVCEEFRYLLVRLGQQLNQTDCEGLMFVHKIPKVDGNPSMGLHTLSKMEAMGFFEPLHPEKLQEILGKIGRKDLAQDIKEYKQSGVFKKAVKLEAERERENKKKEKSKKKNKSSNEKGVEERHATAKLLSDVKVETPLMERRWRDMFAVALTHLEQLVDQMSMLHKDIGEYDEEEETFRRIEDALKALVTAQDEVDTLRKTLKKAISAAGLKSRQLSDENLLEDSLGSEDTKSLKKSHLALAGQKHSPRLVRANTYDGVPRKSVIKTSSATPNSPLPSVSLPLSTSTTPSAASLRTPAVPPPPPIHTIPTLASADSTKSKATPSAEPSIQTSPTITPICITPPTAPSDPTKMKATPLAVVAPASPSMANKSKATPPAVKTKPTPEFKRKKMENNPHKPPNSPTIVFKSARAHASSQNPASPLTAISKCQTFPAISKTLEQLSDTTPPSQASGGDNKELEHLYDNPNLSREESEDMYMNSSMVVPGVVGPTTQLGGGTSGVGTAQPQQIKRKESSVSVQTDSGYGHEDQSWPEPELKEPHVYQNFKILTEYAKPDATAATSGQVQTGQYTQPSKTGPAHHPQPEESEWGTIVHHNHHPQGTTR